MNHILVIGETGTVGRQVLSRLADRVAQVRALARNPSAARFPPQVEVVRGDLTLPETLDACLDGIDTVFLVWTAPAAAVAPALERIAKRTKRIVFLSAPLKTPHPLFQQPNPLRVVVEQIERLIENSGIQWTLLRPGMFAAKCCELVGAADSRRRCRALAASWRSYSSDRRARHCRSRGPRVVRGWTRRCGICSDRASIPEPIRAGVHNRPGDRPLSAHRRDLAR